MEETVSHLIRANKLCYISEDVLESYMQLTNDLRRMLNGYIAFLKRSKNGENEPGSELREDSKHVYMDEQIPEPLDPTLPGS